MPDILDYRMVGRPVNIPQDLNAEVLLGLYPDDAFLVRFCGLHKRNSYRDILEIEQHRGKFLLHLGRNSLYNSLPENLFHGIDRFDHIPEHNKKELFAEEYARQEQEKEQAYRFFSPIDTMLLQLRLRVREHLRRYAESNTVIQQILLDRLSKEQLGNRFIKRTVPYVVFSKNIRGNRTLITLLLRKVFMDEEITIRVRNRLTEFRDENPRYDDSVGGNLGEVYAGNEYPESVLAYSISFWPDEECNSDFLTFIDEVEVYRNFVQDYFLSVDAVLEFDISKDSEPLRISDTETYNYLNFNTNI